jgi:hypothetical protein
MHSSMEAVIGDAVGGILALGGCASEVGRRRRFEVVGGGRLGQVAPPPKQLQEGPTSNSLFTSILTAS